MPWEVGDVDQFKKGLTETQKRRWVEVANSALADCLKEGGDDCEASAIKQANAVIEEAAHEHVSLADKLIEAVISDEQLRQRLSEALQGSTVTSEAITDTTGSIIEMEEAEFVEDGAIVKAGDNDV